MSINIEFLRRHLPNFHQLSNSDIMDRLIRGEDPLEIKNILMDRYNLLSGRGSIISDEDTRRVIDLHLMELARDGSGRGSTTTVSEIEEGLRQEDARNSIRGGNDEGPSIGIEADDLDNVVGLKAVDANSLIEANSESISVKENTSRFSDAVWFEIIKSRQVLLAGVGGIGSYVAYLLARLDIQHLTLYDDDTVEAVNMSGQLFGSEDIGKKKVDAIGGMLNKYSRFNKVTCYREKFTREKAPKKVMICGFDNMTARKDFYASWKSYVRGLSAEERAECLFIDGRLAAEELQVLAFTGNDDYYMKQYEEVWLFSDEEAEETLCSYKQTTFMANMIGSIMVNIFVNHAANQAGAMRQLPFVTNYGADSMHIKVEK